MVSLVMARQSDVTFLCLYSRQEAIPASPSSELQRLCTNAFDTSSRTVVAAAVTLYAVTEVSLVVYESLAGTSLCQALGMQGLQGIECCFW